MDETKVKNIVESLRDAVGFGEKSSCLVILSNNREACALIEGDIPQLITSLKYMLRNDKLFKGIMMQAVKCSECDKCDHGQSAESSNMIHKTIIN